VSDREDDSGEIDAGRGDRTLDGDAYLHARAQAGLVVRSYRKIPRSEQQDIVQTVLATACQAMARPDFEFRKEPGVFIRTLAHRACINWFRKFRPDVPIEFDRPSISPLPLDKIIAHERKVLATEIMNQLSPACRELIQKHLFEGLSYGEIAAATGRSEGALRVEMTRCLRKARELSRRLLLRPGTRNGGGPDRR
jgi:RNA polymerase sigma factor (sigma-70 family)